MRRFFSIFTLLIAASWLVGGVSAEMSDGVSHPGDGVTRTSEVRLRTKAIKVHAAATDWGRLSAPTAPGLDPRLETVVRGSPPVVTRGALLAQRPRSVALPPPEPSLTGQVVLVV